MLEHVRTALTEAQQVLARLLEDEATLKQIAQAGQLLADTFKAGGRAFSCGNGGSMCDAMHFAEELSGRFRKDRPALAALAISDPAHLTCAGNDLGFDEVYARFLEGHGRKGDVLLAISTSGKSRNIIRAAEQAQKQGLKVIALTGKAQSALSKVCDLEICTLGTTYADRVQELHIKVIHTLIELVERQMFKPTY